MKRDLEILDKDNGISVKARREKKSIWSKLKTLLGAGVSLGFVLFVAIQSASLMNQGTHLVAKAWHETAKHDKRENLTIPVMPSVVKAQVYRSPAAVRVSDTEVSREKRLYIGDLWNRFNQTLSTVRGFTR